MCKNEYLPLTARISSISEEAGGDRPIKTFALQFVDPKVVDSFTFKPGQCVMVGQLGYGESMFAISSSPTFQDAIKVSVMRYGKVTSRLHELDVGDVVSVRGPYGNAFPVDEWEGKHLLFIGAGIGISPVRSVYQYVLAPEHRSDYGEVTLIYGARTKADLAFKDEFKALEDREDLKLWLCIDWKIGPEGPIEESAEAGWPALSGSVGSQSNGIRYTCFVPQLVEAVEPSPENAVVVTCGPPIAIKFIIQALGKLGWNPDQIYTTLENRMKCGIGKCGRCNIGGVYVCRDGPVFSAAEIEKMQSDF